MDFRKRTMTALDPRPKLSNDSGKVTIAGVECLVCRYVAAFSRPLCPLCGGEVADRNFGPGATVWSSTVVRVPTPDRLPPYGLAYVDLDDGPRILAHVHDRREEPLHVGDRIVLRGLTDDGDPEVEVIG